LSGCFDQSTRLAHDVFISHASKDKRIADAICEELESSGLKCWIAPRDIARGEDWTKAIRDAIESSPLLLLVFSDNANAAPHIKREIANAYYTRRMIVPIRLAKALPQRDFLFYLKNARWIDADGQSAGQDIKTLPMRIKSLLGGLVPGSCHDTFSESLVTTRSMTLRPVHARHGRPQSVPFGIPRIKRIAISASIIVAVGFGCWLVAQQTDPVRESNGTYSMSMNNNGKNSPTPAKTQASEAVPHYEFSRFGLWVPASASLTPPVDAKPGNTSSPSQQVQAAGATPLQPTDIDRDGGEKEELPAEHHVKAGPLSLTHKAARTVMHRGRPRSKVYARRGRPSEESAFRSVKDWVKSFFRRDPDL
jgi:hypothetical protein